MNGADSSDARLARVLLGLEADLRKGAPADLEGAARANPDIAADLRGLWAVARLADEAARAGSSGGGVETMAHGGGAPMSVAGEARAEAPAREDLPRRFGGYELLEELGRGGMGIVYRATELSLGRAVALKLILGGPAASAADVARFRGEAEAAGRLDHPGIVPVYTVGDEGGQPYFTMKLVDGTTLARLVAKGPLPPREAASILLSVCRAIHHAHEHGLLHRDLKPSNILISADGRASVTDFGLAKRITEDQGLTRTGAILGTPSFMAPEQAAGSRGKVTARTDVYSLGAILYVMLTGRPPFLGATALETVFQVLEQEPLPPRLFNAAADRDLEMVALKCLQKPPELRYVSALDLARDLEAYLASEQVSARSGNLRDVIARLFRETHHASVLENWGLLWVLHGIVILVLCILTSFLQWRGVHRPEPYLGMWCLGFTAWAFTFWGLRRRAGPVTFVERQIAHVWASSMAGCTLLFLVEIILGLPTLTLSPVIALFSGGVFLVKAGILSGSFYIQAGALFLTAIVMALLPGIGIAIFGLVSSACFLIPGLRIYLRGRPGRTRDL